MWVRLWVKQQQPNVTTIKEIELCSSNIKLIILAWFTSWPGKRGKQAKQMPTYVFNERAMARLRFIEIHRSYFHKQNRREKKNDKLNDTNRRNSLCIPYRFFRKMIIISFVNILHLMAIRLTNVDYVYWTQQPLLYPSSKWKWLLTKRMEKHQNWFVFAYIMSACKKLFMASRGKTNAKKPHSDSMVIFFLHNLTESARTFCGIKSIKFIKHNSNAYLNCFWDFMIVVLLKCIGCHHHICSLVNYYYCCYFLPAQVKWKPTEAAHRSSYYE